MNNLWLNIVASFLAVADHLWKLSRKQSKIFWGHALQYIFVEFWNRQRDSVLTIKHILGNRAGWDFRFLRGLWSSQLRIRASLGRKLTYFYIRIWPLYLFYEFKTRYRCVAFHRWGLIALRVNFLHRFGTLNRSVGAVAITAMSVYRPIPFVRWRWWVTATRIEHFFSDRTVILLQIQNLLWLIPIYSVPLKSVCPVLISVGFLLARRLHHYLFIVGYALTFSHVTITTASAF